MPEYPSSLPPEGQSAAYVALVGAHDTLLRGLHELMSSDRLSGDLPVLVPYALYVQILQIGRAAHALVRDGYPEEALPLTRVMISATLNLAFIARSEDAGGWSLRYWMELGQQEIELLDRQLKLDKLDHTAVRERRRDARANLRGLKEAAAEKGWKPPDKLTAPGAAAPEGTWTGLSEHALARRLSMLDWYDVDYSYASSFVHAGPVVLQPIVHRLLDGHAPTIGPNYRQPLPALTFAANALLTATDVYVAYFSIDERRAAVRALAQAWSEAIANYRNDSGANAMIAAIFGPPSDQRDSSEPPGDS